MFRLIRASGPRGSAEMLRLDRQTALLVTTDDQQHAMVRGSAIVTFVCINGSGHTIASDVHASGE
jgi:hypothetical protein